MAYRSGPSEAARGPKARRSTGLLLILLTAVFMTTADNSIVNVAIPSIAVGLRASGGELELAVSAYILAYAVLLVTGARLGSLFGYRRVFLIGLALFTLGSLACGLAPDPVALILARVLQGIGAAIMVPQVLSGIQLNFDGTERARALAFYPVALAGGAAAGQVLGGALISLNLYGSSWRPIFLVNVPVGAALAQDRRCHWQVLSHRCGHLLRVGSAGGRLVRRCSHHRASTAALLRDLGRGAAFWPGGRT
jgi:MFS family permease